MTTSTLTSQDLIRKQLWNDSMKETLKDELMAMQFVDFIDFPDGETFITPSVGDALAEDYVEGTAVNYRPYDTGEFQFKITEYKQSGTTVTKKNMQDSYYMDRISATFPTAQARAIMESFEAKLFRDPEDAMGTTPTNLYTINGSHHRFSAGLSSSNNTLDYADFAYAKLALQKANVPMQNLAAIVPPEVSFKLETLSNVVTLANNPKFEGLITTGLSTGFKYMYNIFGFDVFVSNRLPDTRTLTNSPNALPKRDGTTAGPDYGSTEGRPVLFFSAASGEVNPFMASWRQQPELDMGWDMDNQRYKFLTTARWGSKLYRPENMVIAYTSLAIA